MPNDILEVEENFGDVSVNILSTNRERSISDVSTPFETASVNILTNNRERSISCASTRLPNGIDTNGRPIAGIDWDRTKVTISVEGKPVTRFPTLADAAPHYKGYIWCFESTADSFELQNRQIDLDAIKANDIRAYCFNPKFTSHYRIQWEDIPKTDDADSEVIRRIFTTTKITCGRFKQLVENDELRDVIKDEIVEDRYLHDGAKSLEVAKKLLPEFKNVPEYLHEFLYIPTTIKAKNPKNPTPKKQVCRLLLAAVKVREAGRGWRTFRRQVGNYGQGYGNMLRSEFYWWLVRILVQARLKKAGITKTINKSHIDPKTKEEKFVRLWTPQENAIKKDVMRQVDHVLKWLWNLTA